MEDKRRIGTVLVDAINIFYRHCGLVGLWYFNEKPFHDFCKYYNRYFFVSVVIFQNEILEEIIKATDKLSRLINGAIIAIFI
ncbi:hypothetical protein GCM10022257_13240 [Hyunsoonleella aestuarii]|uniref:NYN domain-containing protein n=1 Tax=Hyunsoonleella aestuarii TaxID=912802 RepID=A0ABP8EAY8_9FLAO